MNKRKLKAKLKEMDIVYKELAAADCLDLALCTVSQKINGVRPWYLDEINKVAERLKLTPQEYYDIFFGK